MEWTRYDDWKETSLVETNFDTDRGRNEVSEERIDLGVKNIAVKCYDGSCQSIIQLPVYNLFPCEVQ